MKHHRKTSKYVADRQRIIAEAVQNIENVWILLQKNAQRMTARGKKREK